MIVSLKNLLSAALIASAAILPFSSSALAADSGVELGLLSCTVEGGFGLLLVPRAT